MDLGFKQALADLRDLINISERDIETALGGTLPLAGRHALQSAISRGFEIGSAYGRMSVLEAQELERKAPTTPPPPGYEEDYAPPPTPYLGHPAARRRKLNGGNPDGDDS
jgi:hypothetical protein